MQYLSDDDLMIVKLSVNHGEWLNLLDTTKFEYNSDFPEFQNLGFVNHALVDYHGRPMACGVETPIGRIATLTSFRWRGDKEAEPNVLCLSSNIFFHSAIIKFSTKELMEQFLEETDQLIGYLGFR